MMYHFIKLRKESHIAYLTLARAEKRNAFTPTTVNEVAHAVQEINSDDDIKVVLLEAEGPVFCAGMDLKTFRDESLDVRNNAITYQNISLGEVFSQLHKPSVAILNGDVVAGGFLYVLGCTYVFAKPEVRFRLPELDLGIFPFQVMASLLKVMPEKKVLQLCLNTDYFSVDEAINLGIVDGLLDAEKIEALLNRFGKANTNVLKAGFESVRNLPDLPTNEQYSYLKQVLERLR
ncbi:enoyl-CoA hydratase/isomerase family protein [Sphingobacterium corticis]|uniref:Enoyl-CoA hydratase/isomerase family protein n=1 Tax=Sphingobacterium corticis TaxID=1812823 RepID=A0ABW5NJ93_9SPHI